MRVGHQPTRIACSSCFPINVPLLLGYFPENHNLALPREFHAVRAAVEHPLEQFGLELNPGENPLFDAVFGDEVDDIDAPALLADAVDPPDALVEFGRVPGQLEIDHAVGGLQVQSGTAGVRGQKHQTIRIVAELVDQGLSFRHRYFAGKLHEIDPEFDYVDDKRIVYWRQERNGMWMRVAIIAKLFGVDAAILEGAK